MFDFNLTSDPDVDAKSVVSNIILILEIRTNNTIWQNVVEKFL